MTRRPLLCAALLGACKPASTQTPASAPTPLHPDARPMTPEAWDFSASEATFGEHLGRPALRLRGGFAFAKDLELADGVLDFDMAAEPGVSFAGVAWHVRDEDNFEKIYLRPFLSGSREATQYTPVFNHVNAWQLYHGPGYNQPVRFDGRRWMPVRVVVSDGQAELYVRDLETPLFTVTQRRADASGRVALYVEPIPTSMSTSAVWFSNVRFTPQDAPPLRGTPDDPPLAGRIPAWRVSQTFAAASMPADGTRPEPDGAWATLQSEDTGLLNLARAHPVDAEHDTALACTTITTAEPARYRLRFGFSEAARLWWNGAPVFDGDDTWHSRDITFQGVVGLWDAVWLQTRAGANELCIAVTENVDMRGGWGLLAAFDDVESLNFDPS
ncbi:MAG: hypothetical protein AAGA54_26690 [Myxococcota bacterium]